MKFRIFALLGAVLLAMVVALPVEAQVRLEDLNFQNKPVEPGRGMPMVLGTQTGSAGLGDGVIVFKFMLTDVDPIADDDHFQKHQEKIKSDKQAKLEELYAAKIKEFKESHPNALQTESFLVYSVVKEGKGTAPQFGDNILMDYSATTSDGKKLGNAKSTSLQFGKQSLIPGWQECLTHTSAGMNIICLIPPYLGAQHIPSMPPNVWINLDLTVTKIEK